MRHNRINRRFDRKTSHRLMMFNNLMTSLIKYEKITTTLTKAKELKRNIERIITLSKTNSVHSRRLVFRSIKNKLILTKLFNEIAPRYSERNGGYTRIIKTNYRKGDCAPLSIIELVEKEIKHKSKKSEITEIENKNVAENTENIDNVSV